MTAEQMWFDAYKTHQSTNMLAEAIYKYEQLIRTYPDRQEAQWARKQLEIITNDAKVSATISVSKPSSEAAQHLMDHARKLELDNAEDWQIAVIPTYETVIQSYPGTKQAALAKDRLEAITSADEETNEFYKVWREKEEATGFASLKANAAMVDKMVKLEERVESGKSSGFGGLMIAGIIVVGGFLLVLSLMQPLLALPGYILLPLCIIGARMFSNNK